jgi:serine protease
MSSYGRKPTGRFRRNNEGEDGPPRVAVKLSPRIQARAQQTPEVIGSLLEKAADGAARGGREPRPLFDTIEASKLAGLVEQAIHLDPEYEPVDFGAWWQIELSTEKPAAGQRGILDFNDDRQVDELVRRLQGLTEIEGAQVLRPGPPPVNALDDPRATNQGYLDAAPAGIDARFAWGYSGGDGAGIGFVDLEQGWNLDHEDLAGAGVTLISGTNTAFFFHGTSVLGEVLMVDNTVGGVGIAPSCTGRVISQYQPGGYNTAATIVAAIPEMVFGDVLLLEAQEYDPVSGDYFWPVEVADANYDAIRLATALGITVVEAGCNGGYDLDAYLSAGGRAIFDRTSSDFRDSGAIMIGAASSGTPHSRLSFSNFGSRIDCYGWGESIDTATTDSTGTDDDDYTTGFNGTSGASPIVVGAALIVQGIAQASRGYRFSPQELRQLLKLGGTASAAPASDLIGVMPNLRSIITNDRINLAPDVFVRDYVGDGGNPTSGFVSRSPDIIVRQGTVISPQVAFGSGSGTENSDGLSDGVIAGFDHHLYVRMLNRGGSPATNVEAEVYWSPPSTLVTPSLWNLIGTATVPNVPTAGILAVSDEITWPAAEIPGPGHYCFVAMIGNAEDPKPGPASFGTWNDFVGFIENQNNAAWRNFDVQPAPPSAGEAHILPFLIPGAFDSKRRFSLESVGRLPRDAKVELELPLTLARQLRLKLQLSQLQSRDTVRIALHPYGNQLVGAGALAAESIAECTLHATLPTDAYEDGGTHEFAIRQVYGETEVGRLTWRFGTPKGEAKTDAKER